MKRKKVVQFKTRVVPRTVIGTLLRQKRELIGTSQLELALDLRISVQFLNKIETGYCSLPIKQSPRFMKAYGISKETMLEAFVADYVRKIQNVIKQTAV